MNKKNDHELLAELKSLAAQEKNIHVRVINYLREVDRRELHVARGFSSLFAFCTEYLGFTEAEAHVRIQAMRLSREIPTLSQRIENGELSLTAVAQAQTIFRRQKLDKKTKEIVLKSLENKSTRAAERTLAILFPNEPRPEKTKAVSAELTRIEFNASQGLMEKLEKLKELLAHKNFSGRYDLLFEHLADEMLKKLEARYSETKHSEAENSEAENSEAESEHSPEVSGKSQTSLGAPQATKVGRYIPAAVKRIVWRKRPMGCTYTDPISGRRCGSKHGLEIDHIKEYSAGGGNETANLQLLCRVHNQFKSRGLTRRFRPP